MTTAQDWLFRSEYLRMQALALREKAKVIVLEAEQYETLALTCGEIVKQRADESQ